MNFKYIDKLQDIVKTYNGRKHRMTQLTPNEGEKKENRLHIQEMHENYYNKIKPTKEIKYKVGDFVRIAVSKPKFSRGYDAKSNEEIYKVMKVIKKFPRFLYQIATLDGDHVIGSFYQEQITKVLNQDEFIVEKVLKSTKKHAFMKFLGYNKLNGSHEIILQPLKTYNDTLRGIYFTSMSQKVISLTTDGRRTPKILKGEFPISLISTATYKVRISLILTYKAHFSLILKT